MHSGHENIDGVSSMMTSNTTAGELFSSHNGHSLSDPMPNADEMHSQHDEHTIV